MSTAFTLFCHRQLAQPAHAEASTPEARVGGGQGWHGAADGLQHAVFESKHHVWFIKAVSEVIEDGVFAS